MTVDMEGFQNEMKTNQVGGGRVAAAKTFLDTFSLDKLKTDGVPLTNDNVKYVWETAEATVAAILNKVSGEFVSTIGADVTGDEAVGVILDTTSFYSEAGGQIYDTGVLEVGSSVYEVKKVLSFGGYVAHIGAVSSGSLSVGDKVSLKVNYTRRLPIASNHTATHQLNWALRQALEREKPDSFMEVNQKGSLVNEEMLRFDFSYNAKLSVEEIARVEELFNEAVAKNLQVYTREVPLELAKSIAGLRPMFGEKYPDPVNMVSIGQSLDEIVANPGNEKWTQFSIEFCGGTHIKNLGEVQRGVIVSEDSLMKGVRRIVMLTRDAARVAIAQGEALVAEHQALLADTNVSDATVKALSVLNKKVGDSQVPIVLKAKLRDDIDTSIKNLNVLIKQRASGLKTEATAYGVALAQATNDAQKFVVDSTDKFGAERELVQAVIDGFLSVKAEVGVFVIGVDAPKDKALVIATLPASFVAKKLSEKKNKFGAERELVQAVIDGFLSVRAEVGVFVIGVDAPKDKALVIATLPASFVAKKLSAVEWAKSVGKGGGKPNAAQAGILASAAADAVVAATAFAKTLEASL
ncbi:alanyl-tRNA synthetase, putative [Bodo saltans]|uniref:alanine--tRNA ligase n=1 Tax=Bodo saltans TaxID=75058 RepID=A0A0S4J4C8_BODSA|nr:alanyl-tRNA synthetase, putative [Bodo saltans]|eukprot:CUG86321.1 alanyl-tRNA synthetase, putative [Bodo saltans]